MTVSSAAVARISALRLAVSRACASVSRTNLVRAGWSSGGGIRELTPWRPGALATASGRTHYVKGVTRAPLPGHPPEPERREEEA